MLKGYKRPKKSTNIKLSGATYDAENAAAGGCIGLNKGISAEISVGQAVGATVSQYGYRPVSFEERDRILNEISPKTPERENLKDYLTRYFNKLINFILKEATPEQMRKIEIATHKRIKELDQNPETAIVRKSLSLAKQKSGNVILLEKIKSKFNETSRSISDEELQRLDLSEYTYADSVQEYLDTHLK